MPPTEQATREGTPRRVVLEIPSFRAWLVRQPRADQTKHLRAMLRNGSCSIAQFAREYRRLWDEEHY